MLRCSCYLLCGMLFLALRAAAPSRGQPEAIPLPRPQWLGVASCAAAACHGSVVAAGEWQSAYTTWMTRDPHARAYEILFDERSRRIMKNLGRDDASTDRQCLQCHAHVAERNDQHQDRFSLADGVGCESCHGPAQHWLSPHLRADWRTLPAAEKAKLGWRDTQSLLGRARACVECHVGTAEAQVNHDLIAAGHPPLRFEFNAYLSVLPPHWSVERDRQRHPDLEIRAWKIGQAVSAQAALDVLAERAAHRNLPWPEFAEYDCSACHQSLRGERRQPRGKPGLLPWSTWYVPRSLDVSFDALKKVMEHPLPDWRKVVAEIKTLRGQLKGWPEKFDAAPIADSQALFRDFVELLRKPGTVNRDEATARFLTLKAHLHAWRSLGLTAPDDATRQTLLDDLGRALPFPQRYDLPDWQPEKTRQIFDALGRLR